VNAELADRRALRAQLSSRIVSLQSDYERSRLAEEAALDKLEFDRSRLAEVMAEYAPKGFPDVSRKNTPVHVIRKEIDLRKSWIADAEKIYEERRAIAAKHRAAIQAISKELAQAEEAIEWLTKEVADLELERKKKTPAYEKAKEYLDAALRHNGASPVQIKRDKSISAHNR
jgi:chromosome segregation ATPase